MAEKAVGEIIPLPDIALPSLIMALKFLAAYVKTMDTCGGGFSLDELKGRGGPTTFKPRDPPRNSANGHRELDDRSLKRSDRIVVNCLEQGIQDEQRRPLRSGAGGALPSKEWRTSRSPAKYIHWRATKASARVLEET